jgi:hypothetical protein
MNRRGFLLGAVAAVQSAMVVAATGSAWRRAYDRDFDGFEPVTDAEFAELVAGYSEIPVPLTADAVERDGPRAFRFTLPAPSSLNVSASADHSDPMFVHPLVLERENGRRFLLPLIRSDEEGRRVTTTAQLGRFEAGEHTITLAQDRAAFIALPRSLRLEATRPAGESLLAKFIDSNPVVRLKNRDNVLDDIPLMAFSKIHRREDRYKVISYIIFSAENGGMEPANLLDAFRRTVDVEWVMQQLFEADGEPIRSRRRFQGSRHRIQRFAGRDHFGNSPVLTTATENNNFSDGRIRLWRWSIPNPLDDVDEDAIYYSPKPVFLPSAAWSTALLERYPELQRWSLFELAMEGCVDLRDLANPAVVAFLEDVQEIERHIQARYAKRECRRLLQVPGA